MSSYKSKPANLLEETNARDWRDAEPEKVTTVHDGRDARITKTVRIRLRYSEALRDEAFRRSRASGNEISQADLLDEAMQEWCLKHGIFSE